MSRFTQTTNPTAEVTVTSLITRKMRDDLRTLAFAKENKTIKSLLFKLIEDYLCENKEFLDGLVGLREEPAVPEAEVTSAS